MQRKAWAPTGGQTLLVISGNAADRRLIARIAGRKFEVAAARDGGEAIDILSTRSFDAVVLDLTLPRLRGADVLAYYHGRYPDRRNIVVTGQREQLALIESDAVHALIPKPLHALSFIALLRDCACRQLAAGTSRIRDRRASAPEASVRGRLVRTM